MAPVSLLNGRLQLQNPTVMAPMQRDWGVDHVPSLDSVKYYSNRAAGGAGLIVSEGTLVSSKTGMPFYDPTNPGMSPGIFTDEQEAVWKKVIDEVKANGGQFMNQIWHTGRFSPHAPKGIGAVKSMASYTEGFSEENLTPVTVDELMEIKEAYANASLRSVRAGAIGVEIHGAHGYFLHAADDETMNDRGDAFGPSKDSKATKAILANTAVPVEVYDAATDSFVEGWVKHVDVDATAATALLYRFSADTVVAVRELFNKNNFSDRVIQYRLSQWDSARYSGVQWANPASLLVRVQLALAAGVEVIHASARKLTQPMFPDYHPTRGFAGWIKWAASEKGAAAFEELIAHLVASGQAKNNGEGRLDNATAASSLPALLAHVKAANVSVDAAVVIGVGSVALARDVGDNGMVPDDEILVTDPRPAVALIGKDIDLLALGRVILADATAGGKVLTDEWATLKPYSKACLFSRE